MSDSQWPRSAGRASINTVAVDPLDPDFAEIAGNATSLADFAALPDEQRIEAVEELDSQLVDAYISADLAVTQHGKDSPEGAAAVAVFFAAAQRYGAFRVADAMPELAVRES